MEKKKGKISWKKALVILLVLLLFLFGLFLHHSPSGTSEGTLLKIVLDQDDNPVEGAVVKLSKDPCGNTIVATETTDSQGEAEFEDLNYGTYYVNISYTYCGKTYYGEEDWEEITIDDEIIEVTNFLEGYPEKVPEG